MSDISPHARNRHILHIGAVASALLSGVYALAAFVFGSPLDFGVAAALCGAFLIVDDFIAWRDPAPVKCVR